jgi:low affinity Fe/Cu permease
MTSQTELLRFGLAALLTGLAIPLLVQLFLVLRNVQRATASLDKRLDTTLRDVNEVVAELKRVTVPAPSLTSQLVAAVPAVIAAVHAFRNGLGRDDSALAHTNNHAKEKAA